MRQSTTRTSSHTSSRTSSRTSGSTIVRALRGALAGVAMLAAGSAMGAEPTSAGERGIAQDSQAYFLLGAANGKLSFTATGVATDLVVIRLADGSVFATATIEQLLKGITGDHTLPEQGKPEGGEKPESEGKEPEIAPKQAELSGPSPLTKPEFDGLAVEVKPDGKIVDEYPNVAKAVPAPTESLRAQFTFASIPWIFHGGSVSIYRGATEIDRDLILLN